MGVVCVTEVEPASFVTGRAGESGDILALIGFRHKGPLPTIRSSPSFLFSARRVLVGLIAAVALQGCAYHRLVGLDPNQADQYYHPVSSTATAWGVTEEESVAEKCPTSRLAEVRVKTSFLDSLVTVLTLGFVQPAHFEYRCSKPPTGEGEIRP